MSLTLPWKRNCHISNPKDNHGTSLLPRTTPVTMCVAFSTTPSVAPRSTSTLCASMGQRQPSSIFMSPLHRAFKSACACLRHCYHLFGSMWRRPKWAAASISTAGKGRRHFVHQLQRLARWDGTNCLVWAIWCISQLRWSQARHPRYIESQGGTLRVGMRRPAGSGSAGTAYTHTCAAQTRLPRPSRSLSSFSHEICLPGSI